MRRLNGFNNGRDASSGIGGGKSSFEQMKDQVEALKELLKDPKPYRRMITVQVAEGSFVACPDDDQEQIKEKFEQWLKETYENK